MKCVSTKSIKGFMILISPGIRQSSLIRIDKELIFVAQKVF